MHKNSYSYKILTFYILISIVDPIFHIRIKTWPKITFKVDRTFGLIRNPLAK